MPTDPDDAAKWSPELRGKRPAAGDEDDAALGFASEENETFVTEPEAATNHPTTDSTAFRRFPFDAPDYSEQTAVFREEMATGDGSVRSRLSLAAAMMPRRWIAIAVAVLTIVGLYFFVNRDGRADPSATTARTGAATITSRPAGLQVAIDGEPRGVTPLKLDLPLGSHNLVIRRDDEVRSIPLTIEAGTLVSQYVDLGPASAAPSSGTGKLEVTSDPPGSSVRLDGVPAGATPLSLPTVTVGEHLIVVGTGETAVTRRVNVLPGATASIAASFGPISTRGGWVSFKTPFEMQVFEGGRLIGTTNMDRVMLPTGPHELELLNESLDFRKKMFVEVATGKTVNQTVMVGNGSLSVNASPWADVVIDGRAVGTTPLANISLPIGSHEVVLTHPQHGERRRTVVVTANSPARLGVDFAQ